MRSLIILIVAIILSLPFAASAEIKSVIHSVQQPFGGSQSPDDARIAGIVRAKREALEQFGTYIESTTVVKNSQVDSDEILALTAGVTSAEVIKQKNYIDGDAFGIEITVKVELDTDVIEGSLKKMLNNRSLLKDLKDSREREKELLLQLAELQKENKQKGKTKQQSAELKRKFQASSQKLTAYDWVQRAWALFDGEHYADPKTAIDYITQAIVLDQNESLMFSLRGLAYIDYNQFALAKADFDKAIHLDPMSSDEYFFRGTAFDRLGQYSQAIIDFDQAIHLDPKSSIAYSSRGLAFDRLGQPVQAIADYDQAIRLNPNEPLTISNRGTAHFSLKQYDLAIKDYSQAISIDPKNSGFYNNLGMAFAASGLYDRAVASYDQAILINTNFTEAYNNRYFAYTKLNKFTEAIADYWHANGIEPNSASAHYSLGLLYASQELYDLAIAEYDKAIRLDPNYAAAYGRRGIASIFKRGLEYFVRGNQDIKACEDLRYACQLKDCELYNSERTKFGFCK